MNLTKAVAILLLGGVLVACGSLYEPVPVGVGIDPAELKRSPCACLQLDLPAELPEWFIS